MVGRLSRGRGRGGFPPLLCLNNTTLLWVCQDFFYFFDFFWGAPPTGLIPVGVRGHVGLEVVPLGLRGLVLPRALVQLPVFVSHF